TPGRSAEGQARQQHTGREEHDGRRSTADPPGADALPVRQRFDGVLGLLQTDARPLPIPLDRLDLLPLPEQCYQLVLEVPVRTYFGGKRTGPPQSFHGVLGFGQTGTRRLSIHPDRFDLLALLQERPDPAFEILTGSTGRIGAGPQPCTARLAAFDA